MTWPEMPNDDRRLFPENVESELDGLQRREVSSDTLRREAELQRRLADIETNPAKYAPLQEGARARLAESQAAFAAAAARHGMTHRIGRFRTAEEERNQVLRTIWDTPAATIADVAALLDIALQQPDMSTPGADTVWDDWPYWCLLTRRLKALAPEADFSWLRRPAFVGDDLVAAMLGDDDEGEDADAVESAPPPSR